MKLRYLSKKSKSTIGLHYVECTQIFGNLINVIKAYGLVRICRPGKRDARLPRLDSNDRRAHYVYKEPDKGPEGNAI